jgi:tetratricopeptide (TPR) repeat protein
MSITMERERVSRPGNSQPAVTARTFLGDYLRLAAVFAALAWPVCVCAQQESDWIGKRVVQKYSNFQLRIENLVIDRKNTLNTYRVERVNGPWLWLRAVGVGLSGWAPADRVVPVDQAIEFFTGYIRAYPRDPHGYTMRAMTWHDHKREYDNALGDYNEAIRLNPTNAPVYLNRGNLRGDQKEFDKAIADYNEAIRLDPSYANAYNGRGWAWWNKKAYDKAIADYNEAIRLDPSNVYAYFSRGWAWRDKKEHDKAIADYNEAVRLDPSYADAYFARGDAWNGKKKYDKAIADYNEAIRVDPNNFYAYNGVAWLAAACPDSKFRDGKKAVKFATKACELSEWTQAYPICALAAAHAEAGNSEQAVKWQTKANGMYTDVDDKREGDGRLKLFREKQPYRETAP